MAPSSQQLSARHWLLRILILLMLSGMAAAGSGAPVFSTLKVETNIGQPLFASVKITGTQQELNELVVALAPVEVHRLFGLERPLLPDDVQIAIERVLPTERRMVITTQLPMDEPLLSFVVRYQHGRDTGIRAFNALVNPSNPQPLGLRGATSVAAPVAVIQSPQSTRRNVFTQPAAVAAPASKPLPPVGTGGQYGPVRSGDSTWRIARGVPLQPGQTIHDVIRSIVVLNPDAFVNGDASRLRAGVTLQLPVATTTIPTAPAAPASRVQNAAAPSPAPSAAAAAPPQVATAESAIPKVIPRPRFRPEWVTGVRDKADLEKFVSLIQKLKDARAEQKRLRGEKRILEERAIAMGQRMARMQAYFEKQDLRIAKLRQSLVAVNDLLVKATHLTVQMNRLRGAENQGQVAVEMAILASTLKSKAKSSNTDQSASSTAQEISAADGVKQAAIGPSPSADGVVESSALASAQVAGQSAVKPQREQTGTTSTTVDSSATAVAQAPALAGTTATATAATATDTDSIRASQPVSTAAPAAPQETTSQSTAVAVSAASESLATGASGSGRVAVRSLPAPVVERQPASVVPVRAPSQPNPILGEWLSDERVAALVGFLPPLSELPFIQTARSYGMSRPAVILISSVAMAGIVLLTVWFLWALIVGRRRLTGRQIAAGKARREAEAKLQMATKAARNQQRIRQSAPADLGGVAPYKPPHSSAEETTVSVRELASEPTLQNVKDLLAEVEVQIAFGDLKVARLLVSKGLGMAPSSPPLMAALQRIDGLSHTDDDDWMGGSDESLLNWGNPSNDDETVVPFERRDSLR
ncbi:MAG: hypothetical protein CMQ61_12650 [Gammaproteobacteria bacterium]|nr:hypothetical protein [Gammaproteobacteria bacterium]